MVTNESANVAAGRGRILLADDDEQFRQGLGALLRREGYDCQCAADAPQALARLRASEFDALLSDIYMPGNAGLEMLEGVPQIAAGLPVILMTGRPTVESAVKSIKLCVAGYLVKPPELKELLPLLDKAIEGGRACRQISESRRRFEGWARDLGLVEKKIKEPAAADKVIPLAQYLQLMSSNFRSVLGDMEQTMDLLVRLRRGNDVFREQELLAVLKRTVETLEETRQSFKSKRLAKLRAELYSLLEESQAPGPVRKSSPAPELPDP